MNRSAASFRLRSAVKSSLASVGVEIRRVRSRAQVGSIGTMLPLLEHVRAVGLEPRGILDVGANRGDWSRLAHSLFPMARLVLVEPQHEMAGYLDTFCSQVDGAQWFQVGAGAQAGELILTIWDDLVGSSFLPRSSERPADAARQRSVPVVAIDDLLAEHGIDPPELVKLDVQGFELEALRGASKLFGLTELFIMEASLYEFLPGQPLVGEVITFMAERDYVVYDVAGYERRPYDGALGQLDLCFARAGGTLRRSSRW